MLHSGLLIAAAADWLRLLVPLVFAIVYLLNQLLSARKQAKPRVNPRRVPPADRPPRPAGAPPRPEVKAPDRQTQLNAEIEEFLKRASQRRVERPKAEQSASAKPPKQRQAAKQQRPPRPPMREQPAPINPLGGRESVEQSVEKHLSNRGFRERAEHLTDDIQRVDNQMEEHLQQAFSHAVGTLSADAPAKTPVTDAGPTTAVGATSEAAAIAGLLRNPQTVRQAVILNEILARPADRW